MNKDQFLRSILNKDIQNIYILEGQENYLKQLALDFALDKLINAEFKDLNISAFENPDVKDIIDSAQTMPIMSDYRAIIVRESSLFNTSGKANGADVDSFIKFAENISPDTLLFICVDKIDSRKKASKVFKERIVSFAPFKEQEAQDWVINTARKEGKLLSRVNAQKLILKCGVDASTLKNELDKLIAYNIDVNEISSESIDYISINSISFSVFNMTDSLLLGNVQQAISILKALLKNGENEYMLFATLLREMRLCYYIKALNKEGKGTQDISKICNIMGFAVDKKLKALKNYRFYDIKQAYQYCIDSEMAIKEGKISQDGIAERTLLGIYIKLNKLKNL